MNMPGFTAEAALASGRVYETVWRPNAIGLSGQVIPAISSACLQAAQQYAQAVVQAVGQCANPLNVGGCARALFRATQASQAYGDACAAEVFS